MKRLSLDKVYRSSLIGAVALLMGAVCAAAFRSWSFAAVLAVLGFWMAFDAWRAARALAAPVVEASARPSVRVSLGAAERAHLEERAVAARQAALAVAPMQVYPGQSVAPMMVIEASPYVPDEQMRRWVSEEPVTDNSASGGGGSESPSSD